MMTDGVVAPSSHFCHFLPISRLGTCFPPGQCSQPYPCNYTTSLVDAGGPYMINSHALPLWCPPSPTCLPSPGSCSLQGQLSPALSVCGLLEKVLQDESSLGRWWLMLGAQDGGLCVLSVLSWAAASFFGRGRGNLQGLGWISAHFFFFFHLFSLVGD